MTGELRDRAESALRACGAPIPTGTGWVSHSPIDGGDLLPLGPLDADGVLEAIGAAHSAFLDWRSVPAPVRGGLVKAFGRLLEQHKEALADLVQLEVGKIRSEALGEVQEMIDICDFAIGLSRQLEGRTMPSERPGHRLMETWHPAGVVAVISAFNFPVAVWAWNTTIALVCGDTVIWKPSEMTPLCSLACNALMEQAIAQTGAPADVHRLVLADRDQAGALLDDPRVAVVSATGSERMGAQIGPRVAARFGRTILELGGNNAAIVTPSADLDLALRGIVFAAAGTAGQRCTSMRRVIAHESVAAELTQRIAAAYDGLPVGDPLQDGTLVGPLINDRAYERMQDSIQRAVAAGGTLVTGGERVDVNGADSYYVRPALITMPEQSEVVCEETFAPLLYVMTYTDFDDAIALHNAVPQGLSSSVFTLNQREAELFMSAAGSDCGIVNVNIGTSGAEIGGAFGGEKTTGGGRESGSDAWRGYMRRATNTINYSTELPLAQGVNFG
ncbi:MAG TPA: aldehyde dehydrogenase family protein [Actinomycetota bacterium]|nr:aldehyde dehydrogenase family protein [Actinomycetota bacterium]